MNKFFKAIAAWFLANPVAEHLLEGGLFAGLFAVVEFVKSGQNLTISGLGLAVALALKIYVKANRNLAVAFLQDQVQAIAGSPNSVAGTVAPPTSSALTAVKTLLLFLFLATPSFSMPLFATLNPPPGGEDDIIIAPIGSIEFNPSTKDNYGLAFTECISFSKVLPGQDDKHVVVAPYVFLGVFGAANIGQWVAANGGANWQFDYGPIVGLPKLDDSIPEVAFSYNLRDGAFMINVAFPADILPAFLVHKL